MWYISLFCLFFWRSSLQGINWKLKEMKAYSFSGYFIKRMFLVFLLPWLPHVLNQMLRFAFLQNFKGFPLLSFLICCFWEPYYHSDSLLLFWEFFLPFILKLFLSLFSFDMLGKYLAIFKLGKDASQFWIVMCLIRYGQSNIIITTFYLLLMGKENDQNPLPNELGVRLCQWEVLQGLLYAHTKDRLLMQDGKH